MENASSRSILVKAHAKVNLALDIKGVENNGYHILDSIMSSVDLHDLIRITTRQDNNINVTYKDGQSFERDTALAIAKRVKEHFNLTGFDIYIDKRIPLSSGLGGSSADAAGVARGLQQLFNIDITDELLISAGSDIPFMYRGGACRVQGVGDKLQDISLPTLYVALLVDKNISIDTQTAYKLYDNIGGDKIDIDEFLDNLSPPINALQRASTHLEPNILTLIDKLKYAGFNNVVMTGSGGGVIGYCRDKKMFDNRMAKLRMVIENDNNITLINLITMESI